MMSHRHLLTIVLLSYCLCCLSCFSTFFGEYGFLRLALSSYLVSSFRFLILVSYSGSLFEFPICFLSGFLTRVSYLSSWFGCLRIAYAGLAHHLICIRRLGDWKGFQSCLYQKIMLLINGRKELTIFPEILE